MLFRTGEYALWHGWTASLYGDDKPAPLLIAFTPHCRLQIMSSFPYYGTVEEAASQAVSSWARHRRDHGTRPMLSSLRLHVAITPAPSRSYQIDQFCSIRLLPPFGHWTVLVNGTHDPSHRSTLHTSIRNTSRWMVSLHAVELRRADYRSRGVVGIRNRWTVWM
jgi:hypothetical protein